MDKNKKLLQMCGIIVGVLVCVALITLLISSITKHNSRIRSITHITPTEAPPLATQTEVSPRQVDQRVEDETRASSIHAQFRARYITEIRAAFAEEKPVESATPWKNGVRGLGRLPIFDEICHGLDRFDDMERAFRVMSDKYEPITWEELEIEAGGAGKMYRDIGINTAKLLIKLFEIPRGERKLVSPCSEGKGSWSFADEEVVGNRIVGILDEIHAGASDVGMTSGELRQLLIRELTMHITELRESVAGITAGTHAHNEVDNCLYTLFMEARTSWNIQFDQLGIFPREHAMIEEKTAANTGSTVWCREEVNLTLPQDSTMGVPH